MYYCRSIWLQMLVLFAFSENPNIHSWQCSLVVRVPTVWLKLFCSLSIVLALWIIHTLQVLYSLCISAIHVLSGLNPMLTHDRCMLTQKLFPIFQKLYCLPCIICQQTYDPFLMLCLSAHLIYCGFLSSDVPGRPSLDYLRPQKTNVHLYFTTFRISPNCTI